MAKLNGSDHSVDPYLMIPEKAREGWKRYIEFGEPPDPVAQSIIRNNLLEASWFLDDEAGLRNIYQCIRFLRDYAPAMCYGSQENYDNWVRLQGLVNRERESSNVSQ